jgi:TRAP-type uncharacterized transport system fused permease subunit
MDHILIIGINLSLLLVAYFAVYPVYAKQNINKLALADLVVSLLALAVAWYLFSGSGISFTVGPISLNWFWFSLSTYLIFELILFRWYCKRYEIDLFGVPEKS